MTYIKYPTAIKSKVYIELAEAGEARLTVVGSFSKEEVLEITGYDVVAPEAINWEYVRRMIQERGSTELIPLASAFFKRHREKDVMQFPRRFIAGGTGKATAGYCIASEGNGHFVIERLKMKRGAIQGAVKSLESSHSVAQRAGVKGLDNIQRLK